MWRGTLHSPTKTAVVAQLLDVGEWILLLVCLYLTVCGGRAYGLTLLCARNDTCWIWMFERKGKPVPENIVYKCILYWVWLFTILVYSHIMHSPSNFFFFLVLVRGLHFFFVGNESIIRSSLLTSLSKAANERGSAISMMNEDWNPLFLGPTSRKTELALCAVLLLLAKAF